MKTYKTLTITVAKAETEVRNKGTKNTFTQRPDKNYKKKRKRKPLLDVANNGLVKKKEKKNK